MAQLFFHLLSGSVALFLVFTITWVVQLKTKNAAIVDAVWAASFPVLALIYILQSDTFGLRKGVFLVMVLVWGMRLAAYLFVRTVHHKMEDVRYAALRMEWGSRQNIMMLRFFYFQALLAVVLSLPFAIVATDSNGAIAAPEIIAMILWFVAVLGESIADSQLKNFKSNPVNKGKVCEVGLWYYSRHPNYFFEWMVWVSYFIFSLASPWGWTTIICPLLMLYFLLKVTGIRYTEEQMIKSRGQAFVQYQKTTSAFIPLPKKKLTH